MRGREHTELGVFGAVGEGALAVAISRGGFAKQYAFVDPNEDAAAFALGRAGWLLAVADGHSGFEAAEVALEHLLDSPAPHWTDSSGPPAAASWRRHALAALADAAVHIAGERREGSRSRTTLTLALIDPRTRVCSYATLGDSHLFAIEESGVREVAPCEKSGVFLGDAAVNEKLADHCRLGCFELAGVRALALVTDGLSEEGIGVVDPAAALAEVARSAAREPAPLRPLALARGVCEAALGAHRRQHSGDNVACAAAWLDGAFS